MNRVTQILTRHVAFIPSELEDGVLYVADQYATAVHRCCCGCGNRAVTPLKPGAWTLTEHNGKPSLRPSVGNWSFPCKSHYWIRGGNIDWSFQFSDAEIADNRQRDQQDLEAAASHANKTKHQTWWTRIRRWIRRQFRNH